MRRETFILTLVYGPEGAKEPRGRLRHVSTNRETAFKDLEELTTLLRRFYEGEEWQGQGERRKLV